MIKTRQVLEVSNREEVVVVVVDVVVGRQMFDLQYERLKCQFESSLIDIFWNSQFC